MATCVYDEVSSLVFVNIKRELKSLTYGVQFRCIMLLFLFKLDDFFIDVLHAIDSYQIPAFLSMIVKICQLTLVLLRCWNKHIQKLR